MPFGMKWREYIIGSVVLQHHPINEVVFGSDCMAHCYCFADSYFKDTSISIVLQA